MVPFRIDAVASASSSPLTMIAWLPYNPVWSIIMIAVIWALGAHGRDIAS